MPRSVYWLSAALALFTTGNAPVLSVAVLIGSQLAEDPAHATIPLLAQYIGLISASVPMAHFMMRFGRRAGLFSVISAGWPVHYWQSPVFIHTTCCCFPPERSLPVLPSVPPSNTALPHWRKPLPHCGQKLSAW